MGRQYGLPIRVETAADGLPIAFAWRGRTYRVTVIGHWHLADRRWDRERWSDRQYYRLITADHQVFEVYRELTSKGLWVLDVVQD